jgi:hypothetical protein
MRLERSNRQAAPGLNAPAWSAAFKSPRRFWICRR